MKKVLYIEDDPVNAFVMKRYLSGIYEVTHREDTLGIDELVKKEHFDIFLLDVHLGDENMTGVEILQSIRASQSARCPVIAVTSLMLVEDREELLKAGFDHFVSKPIEKNVILELLSQYQ